MHAPQDALSPQNAEQSALHMRQLRKSDYNVKNAKGRERNEGGQGIVRKVCMFEGSS